jgi:hypothetical protein
MNFLPQVTPFIPLHKSVRLLFTHVHSSWLGWLHPSLSLWEPSQASLKNQGQLSPKPQELATHPPPSIPSESTSCFPFAEPCFAGSFRLRRRSQDPHCRSWRCPPRLLHAT